jgi:hypothetical protein
MGLHDGPYIRTTRSAGRQRETARLGFEHSELVTESEDLGAEPGVRVVPDDEDLEQEADDGADEQGASREHRMIGRTLPSAAGPT